MVEDAEGKAALPLRKAYLAKRQNGKLDRLPEVRPQQLPNQPLPERCPECGSARLYHAGLRHSVSGDPIQRLFCRDCGYRFSEKSYHDQNSSHREPLQKISYYRINRPTNIASNRQVCETLTRGSKNLSATETKTVAGELHETADIKGLIAKYLAWLEKEGYNDKSCYPTLLKTLAKTANLLDPEDVKRAIGKLHCKDGTKMLCVYAYDAFAKMEKITWSKPRYRQEENLPFVPDEAELDSLIASCQSKRMAAFLQALKETYADPGEVLRLRWIDISGNVVTINNPVKGHLPGQIEVTNKLPAMLNCLPKNSDRIFQTNYSNMYTSFDNVRHRAARMLQNPRLLRISFKSFRHWGGSMIAHYTNGNVLTVKKLLRHKRVENTMKYISMIHFKDDEFEVTTATTVEEAKQVLSAGFDYITEKHGVMLFKRPKRFRSINAGLGV